MPSEIFSLRRLLIKNTGIQLAAQVVAILVSLATTFVLSRYLGVSRFGGLNYIFAFYYFFLILGDFGVGTIVVRECSRKPEDAAKIIGTMGSFRLGIAFLSAAVSWIIIYLVPFSPGLKTPLFIYALILPLIALQLPGVIFQINLNARYPAVIGIAKGLANFIFLIALVFAGLGMTAYVLALVLSEIIATFLTLFLSKPFVRPVWKMDWEICRKIIKSSLVLGSATIFVAIVNRVDFIMLERMTDLRQVGLYAVSYKFTNLLESLPLAVMTTLYPVMSGYGHQHPRKLQALYQKTLLLFSGFAVPLGLAVTFFAVPIVTLFFGTKFIEAAPGLQVLIWATVFLYLALSGGNVLISLGHEKINLGINIAAAVLNIALNFIWIPRYGFVGAAWATVCSFFLVFAAITFSAWFFLKASVIREQKAVNE